MKPLASLLYRDFAWEGLLGRIGAEDYGCFIVPLSAMRNSHASAPNPVPTFGTALAVIASTSDGWDHLSVSVDAPRCPSWSELEFVKHLFFREDETAMQLHVPPAEHVNIHPYCLHLWRPQAMTIPRPPQWMVA